MRCSEDGDGHYLHEATIVTRVSRAVRGCGLEQSDDGDDSGGGATKLRPPEWSRSRVLPLSSTTSTSNVHLARNILLRGWILGAIYSS